MTSVKDSCPNCHEWINRCTCPPDQPCDCVSDHHSIDISDGPCGCDCHLKPKPETLGFEREADQLFQSLYLEWGITEGEKLKSRTILVLALEAAFSKGIEEQEKRCGTHCVPVGEKAFSDGWNACQKEAAKVAENCLEHKIPGEPLMVVHSSLIEKIRALKPAKGERT